jgi:hypothetical protein
MLCRIDTWNTPNNLASDIVGVVFLLVGVLGFIPGVLIAAAVTDNGDDGQGFGARCAWLYVTLLSIGYMISRGLAKAGSHRR